jgi:type II secretory pathway pseudopilin PulG
MQKYSTVKLRSSGFTIVEILVVTVVLGLLSIVVLGVLGDFYTDTNTTLQQTTKYTDTQNALATIKNDLATSKKFIAKPTDAASPAYPNLTTAEQGWSYAGTAGTDANARVLITLSYATAYGATGVVPSLMNCSGTMVQTTVIRAYFVKQSDHTLYRRTFIPSSTLSDYCNGFPIQKQTCDYSVTPKPSNCQAPDAVIERNVTSFQVDYYNTTNGTSADLKSSDLGVGDATQLAAQTATINGSARKVQVSITTTQHVKNADVPQTANTQIALSSNVDTASLGADTGSGSNGPPDIGGGSPGDPPGTCTGNSYSDTWDIKLSNSDSGVIYVPPGATTVDYFLVGGGGGGQGGWIWSAGGGGGGGGSIAVGSKIIPSGVDTIAYSVGKGGSGTQGSGYYNIPTFPFFYTIFYPQNGGNGGRTYINMYNDQQNVGASAAGGAGGSGANNHKTGYYPVPSAQSYLGRDYCGGLSPGVGVSLGNGPNAGTVAANGSKAAGSGGAGGSGVSGDNFVWDHAFAAYNGGNGSDGIIRLKFH